MGAIQREQVSTAVKVYRHLVQICQRQPYVGQLQPMTVLLNNELDFRRRNKFILHGFETFTTWDDESEVPVRQDPLRINSFYFDHVARIKLHWRKGRFARFDDESEDMFECYVKRMRGDWSKTMSFSTADAQALKRGLPLLTKAHYETLIAESDPSIPVSLIYSELQRLMKALTDDRNYNISIGNVPSAMLNALELESPGLLWAKDQGVVAQNVNGEFHKTF